jgi:hypothetical protein
VNTPYYIELLAGWAFLFSYVMDTDVTSPAYRFGIPAFTDLGLFVSVGMYTTHDYIRHNNKKKQLYLRKETPPNKLLLYADTSSQKRI